ncbi:lipoprotein [Erwinia endophytica]|uniref:lipoprotein YedD n=1 Tax=Erwinia endophytica TaxID=1563158 RepID=UPI001265E9CB|nr:lipoprotein YedD [Erwinia endophytica]KAB8310725.1 lipoprotein [Erwinia endophytica]
MQKWILVAAVLGLAGCARIPNYQSAVKTPPPVSLVGNWQTMGPQKGLVSKEAIASLIITAEGDTLDCRQWQRVIAKPGKVTLLRGDWVNVNNQLRVMPLKLVGSELHYDKLVLQKVYQPTAECQDALKHEDNLPAPPSPKITSDVTGKKHHKSMLRNDIDEP